LWVSADATPDDVVFSVVLSVVFWVVFWVVCPGSVRARPVVQPGSAPPVLVGVPVSSTRSGATTCST